MFDRLIVINHQGAQQIFYVPTSLRLEDFIENIKAEIVTKKRYNSEIKQIKRQLDVEQESLEENNNDVITAQQGNKLIKRFVENHPMDDRNVEDILRDSGAVEICDQIPPQNFIYDD